ncbi:MAG: hypothetical protein R2724_19560 [Bryobacterales bacterium]
MTPLRSASSANRASPSHVQAFSAKDGSLLWEKSFDAGSHLPEVHIKHNLSSPSCVTDGERVYAWFGTGLVVALSMDGKRSSAAQSGPGVHAVRRALGPRQFAHAL